MVKKVIIYIMIFSFCVETIFIIVHMNNTRYLSCSNFDMGSSIIWMQYSAEYEAICYQIFNLGKQYVSSLENSKTKRAVVCDVDETVLNNILYESWLLKYNKKYSSKKFTQWCKQENATTISGAVDFCNFVKSKNIEIFYISKRKADDLEATINNMNNLGFPFADKNHVIIAKKHKSECFDYIKKIGFEVVLFVDDDINNFNIELENKNFEYRKKWVCENKDKFGFYYLVLPNPVYGSFQKSLYTKYSKFKFSMLDSCTI